MGSKCSVQHFRSQRLTNCTFAGLLLLLHLEPSDQRHLNRIHSRLALIHFDSYISTGFIHHTYHLSHEYTSVIKQGKYMRPFIYLNVYVDLNQPQKRLHAKNFLTSILKQIASTSWCPHILSGIKWEINLRGIKTTCLTWIEQWGHGPWVSSYLKSLRTFSGVQNSDLKDILLHLGEQKSIKILYGLITIKSWQCQVGYCYNRYNIWVPTNSTSITEPSEDDRGIMRNLWSFCGV